MLPKASKGAAEKQTADSNQCIDKPENGSGL